MPVYIYFFLFFLYLSLTADGVNNYFQGRHWQFSFFSGIAGVLSVFCILWKMEFLYICILGGFSFFSSDLSFSDFVKMEIWNLWKLFMFTLNSVLLVYAVLNAFRFGKSGENSLYLRFKRMSSYRAVLYFANVLLAFGWVGGIILFVP